jgi:hypothetical protein
VTWQKGQSGNPGGQHREKPFRDELRKIALTEERRRLATAAKKLFDRADQGDVAAIKEIGDRLDGKVPQAIVGDEEHPPVIPGYRWLRDDEESE